MESGTPLSKAAAQGNDLLDVPQRAAVIGDVVPIVFARRVSGVGGVLISPPATEARFSDFLSGDVNAQYHLVLGEGLIDSLQVRDVFQRSCRVGTFTQTYDKRAGTFIPGNFISNTPNLEAPNYCGTGGTYEGLSTMAFSVTIPAGFDYWNRQVHCFVRGGLHVPRLLDSITGPSNNVADLLLYLLRNSSRVPEAQIDTASMLAAATFTNVNGFWFNGVIQESTNLRDWTSSNLQYFLLRLSRVAGKEALTPLLPTNNDGTIKTTAVSWAFTFTEQHIIPDSFEITYTPLADRKPFVVTVLWRQQDDFGIPLIRTTEVRYAGTAEDGPYEQHDLSAFCAVEDHAVKAGTYILSRRNHITHRLSIGVKPDAFNPTLTAGDLVRVRLDRIASNGADSRHDYLYEVDLISKSFSGDVRLELTHFPIDGDLASVVAKEVAAAVGAGVILPTGLSTVITCDANSDTDTTVPADTSLGDEYWEEYWEDEGFPNILDPESFETEVTEVNPIDTSGLGGTDGTLPSEWTSTNESDEFGNPSDGLDRQGAGGGGGGAGSGAPSLTSDGDINNPAVGDTLTAPTICAGGQVVFYRIDPSVPGGKVQVQEQATYTLTINDIDKSVYAETRCPDPTSPTGYGEPIDSTPTAPIAAAFDPQSYDFFRYKRSNGSASDWYSTATHYGGFWGNNITPQFLKPGDPTSVVVFYQDYYNARIVWGVGAAGICVRTCSGFGDLAYILIKGIGQALEPGGSVATWSYSGGPSCSFADQTQEYCSTATPGVWEFAFAANPTQVVREWNGTNMGDPEANWPT
jgi:hypothetical protein